MKKFISSLIVSLAVLTQTAFVLAASTFWNVDISTPATSMNTRNFQLQFTTLSTDASNSITIEAFQNSVSIGSQTVTAGGSGAFAVSVPADGSYSYFVKASNTSIAETKTTATKTVVVDTTAPSSSSTSGSVVRNGNSYTLNFTAPISSDVAGAEVYASTSTSVDTSSGNLVGTLTVTSGQKISFSYTSPDSSQRNFAVRFVDKNGNVSALTVVAAAGLGATTNTSTTTATSGGQVAGTDSNKSNGGVVDKNAATDQVASTVNKDDSGSAQWWVVALLVVLVAGAGYVYYANGKSGDNE
ncbi:MAG: hypothetical protein AAB459_03665 [Patescibacteria group bacterium]